MAAGAVRHALRALTLATWLAFGLSAQAAAQVVADPTAGANRPTVLQTANGLDQVNIPRPSAAGVSTNAFTRFDVPRAGVILNNSPAIIATRQAGYVNGNRNLPPGGSARIIVNQVTSALPSQLRGYLEVAGPRCEVIVANPNGILVDGAGFINTSRATLTTGVPMPGGSGSLEAYRVTGGRIAVEGAGLDATGIDQVDLIARAVSANAAVHANRLGVVAGANQIEHGTLAATPIAGIGPAPALGIDVSQLGGMYANKIVLASTELGVGVSNRGMLAAQAGELTLTTEGRLVLAGQTHARGSLTVEARDGIDNSGVTYGAGGVSIHTGGTLVNSGTLAAQQDLTATAEDMASSGTLAAGVNDDGAIGQRGDLVVASHGLLSATGRNVAGGDVTLRGDAVDLAGSHTEGNRSVGLTASAGNLDLSGATVTAGAVLDVRAQGALVNDRGRLSSRGTAAVDASAVSNQAGQILAQGPMTIRSTGATDNTRGTMESAGALTLATKTLDNAAGHIDAGQVAIDSLGNLSNHGGTISQYGHGNTTIAARGFLDNTGGTLATNGQVLTVAAGAIDNSHGSIQQAGTGALTLTSGASLANAGGTVQSNGVLHAQAGTVDNRNGTLYGQTGLAIGSDAGLDNGGGNVQTAGSLTLSTSGAIRNINGTVAANGAHGAMAVSAGSIDNSGGRLANAGDGATSVSADGMLTNTGGVLGGNGDTTIAAGDLINTAHGSLVAARALRVEVQGAVDNRQGVVYGQTGLALASGAQFDNSGGNVETNGDLAITAGGAVNNARGTLAANGQHSAMQVSAGSIDNTGGKLANAGDGATTLTSTGAVANTAGVLGGNGDTTVAAGDLINTSGGSIVAGHALALDVAHAVQNRGGALYGQTGLMLTSGGGFDNHGGSAQTSGDMAVSVGGTLSNVGGMLAANGGHGTLSASAGSLDNSVGRLVNAGLGATAITTGGIVFNHGGVLGGNGDTTVAAQGLVNTGNGHVTAGRDLALEVTHGVDNRGGTLYGGTGLTLVQAGASLANQGGAVLGGRDVSVKVASIDNAGGIVRANRDIGMAGQVSGSGEMTAGRDLLLEVTGDYLNDAANALKGDRTLRVASTGTLTNTGTLAAGTSLDVSGADVVNAAGAVLTGGAATIAAANAIRNAGRIDGDTVHTASGTFDNTGTVVGAMVAMHAGDILNNGPGAIVAAARDLKLYAGNSLSNLDGATLYSAGDLQIGRDGIRDGSGMLANQTGWLLNRSATIEADGDVDIAARSVSNIRTRIVTEAGTPQTTTQTRSAWFGGLTGRDRRFHQSLTIPGWRWSGGQADVSAAMMLALRDPVTIEVPKSTVSSIDPGTRTLSFSTAPIEIYGGLYYNCRPETPCEGLSTRPLTTRAQQYYENLEDTGATYRITFWPDWDPNVHIRPDEIRIRTDLGPDNHDYNEIARTRATTVSTDRLVSASDPGMLRAQGAIRINSDGGSILNQSSTMAAGGDLVRRAVGGSVNDIGTALQQTVSTTDTSTFYWHQKSGGDSDTLVVPYPTIPSASTTVMALPAIATSNQSVRTTARDVSVTTVDRAGNTVTGSGITGGGATGGAITGGGVGGGTVSGGGATGPQVKGVADRSVRPQTLGTAQGGIPNLTLPTNGLFRIQPAPGATYLVATDPRFTQYKSFISSDYMLGELGIDPHEAPKRLADGFHEAKLIRDQVTQLTGRTLLAGHSDPMEEYKALMDNGVAYAKGFGLVPGIGLSDEQMQQLTTDMVWLVSQDVTLPDGTMQSVLVPKLYLAQASTVNLNDTGALVAGRTVTIDASGNADNSGRIVGDVATQVLGNNIVNRGVIGGAGGNTVVQAAFDVMNKGGSLSGNDVVVAAGRDVVNETQTITALRTLSSGYSAGGTGVGAVATISASGTAAVLAGRDIDLRGGRVDAGANALLAAGRDLNIATVSLGTTQDAVSRGGQSYSHDQKVSNVSSGIRTGADLVAIAGRDATLSGAAIQAGGDASLIAGRDTTVTAVMDTHSHSEGSLGGKGAQYTRSSYDETARGSAVQAGDDIRLAAGQGAGVAALLQANGIHPIMEKESASTGTGNLAVLGSSLTTGYDGNRGGGVSLVANGDVAVGTVSETHGARSWSESKRSGFLSKEQTTKASSEQQRTAVGSTVSANAVSVRAGRDLTVSGSNVVATHDVMLHAERDLVIGTSASTASRTASQQTRQSGMFSGGGMAVTIGRQQSQQAEVAETTTHTGSVVGSLQGNIDLSAGDGYTQTGSLVNALQGDVDIAAKRVDINAATDSGRFEQESHFRQSGLTIAVSNPLVQAMQTAGQMAQAQSRTNDPRMKAMAAGVVAFAAKDAANAVNADPKAGGGLGISVTVGGAKSDSKQTQTSSTVVGSKVRAGGDIRIRARGAGADSNINVIGSDIQAGNNVSAQAENQVNLLAAANTAGQHSSNQNKSGGIGVAISLGSHAPAIGLTAHAATARGNADGNDLTWTNSHVDAGNTLIIESGGDTTLRGGIATGNRVVAVVGGDLSIESLQDTSTYRSRNRSAGGSVSVGSGFSGSANMSQQTINSDYASVRDSSGIKTGDQGFQVSVAGNTDLKGGVIASTEKAVRDGSNQFHTAGQLTLNDIRNQADFKGEGFGVTLGAAAGAGRGTEAGSAASTTTSGISGIAGNRAVRSGDASTGIGRIFDADKVGKQINAQVRITTALSQAAGRAVDHYVEKNRTALLARLKEARSDQEMADVRGKLDDLTRQERVMNILIGAVTGMGVSAVTKEGLSMAADQLRKIMIEDSEKFAGVTDGISTYHNLSGRSVGVRGDGWKIGGTRWDLEKLCGTNNERCVVQKDVNNHPILDANGKTQLKLNDKGQVQFDSVAAQMNLDDFLRTPKGKELAGLTGGIQGAKGTLFGIPYEPGSWQDRLVESFAGPHDMVGGRLIGAYDQLGNAKRGRPIVVAKGHDIWSATGAIVVSAPFGMSEYLPSQVWNAISVLLKAAR